MLSLSLNWWKSQSSLGPWGNSKKRMIEVWQLTRSKVALVPKSVTLQVVGTFAKDLSGGDVVLHHRLHAVALYWTYLHAHRTALIAGHHGATAIVNELVLLNASVPHLILDQGSAGAAVHAHLALLAELVDAVVYRLVVGHGSVGGNYHQPGPGPKVR